LATFHQHNRKGMIVMIKISRYMRLVMGSFFGAWKLYDFWRRSCGLPCTHRSRVWRYLCLVLLFRFWFFRHTNAMNDTILSPFFSYRRYELASRSHCVLFVCGCCFAGLLFPLFGFSGIVTAIWTVYWSCLSSTFAVHLLWRWIMSLL